ncbi:MAG: SGNH/GDSL hydrolase family protein [Bacteroidota bacterium]
MKNSIFILLTVFLLLNCSKTVTEPIDEAVEKEENTASDQENNPNVEYNLLFVGNSLTYFNDLPNLVEEQAASRNIIISAAMLAQGNYAIVDHWAEGKVQNLIRSRKYDYVIIQQGPSSQADGYDMLLNGGKQYADLCKANDVQLAYYMVWPSRRYYHTFNGVINNYTAAAEANDAVLCPVGKVWKDHFDKTNDFSYYGPDQFHPSVAGSKVAARVIVSSLFK